MAAGIDQIRTRESGAGDGSVADKRDDGSGEDARLVRVDVSGVTLSAVRSIVRERTTTPVYVEHRAGSTYLVADRDQPVA